MLEDQESESSEQSGGTSVAENTESQPVSDDAEKQEAAPETKKETVPETPFHEHPRFKELIDERRAFKEQLDQSRGYMEAMQKEMQELRRSSQAPKPASEPKYKQLIEQVRAVNPEFAQFQEEMLKDLESSKQDALSVKELKQQLESYKTQEFQNQAVSKLTSLMDQNKIPDTSRTRYDREIRYLAGVEESQGKKLTLKDVDRLFKSVHEEYSKFTEDIRRDSLKGYVKDKANDRSPAPTTGGAAVSSGAKKIPSLDTQEGFQQTVKLMAEHMRAAKKI